MLFVDAVLHPACSRPATCTAWIAAWLLSPVVGCGNPEPSGATESNGDPGTDTGDVGTTGTSTTNETGTTAPPDSSSDSTGAGLTDTGADATGSSSETSQDDSTGTSGGTTDTGVTTSGPDGCADACGLPTEFGEPVRLTTPATPGSNSETGVFYADSTRTPGGDFVVLVGVEDSQPPDALGAIHRFDTAFDELWSVAVDANAFVVAVVENTEQTVVFSAPAGPQGWIQWISEDGMLGTRTEGASLSGTVHDAVGLENGAVAATGLDAQGLPWLAVVDESGVIWVENLHPRIDAAPYSPTRVKRLGETLGIASTDGTGELHLLAYTTSAAFSWEWSNPRDGQLSLDTPQLATVGSAFATTLGGPTRAVGIDLTGVEVWNDPIGDGFGFEFAVAGGEDLWVATAPDVSVPGEPGLDLNAVVPGADACCHVPIWDPYEGFTPEGLLRRVDDSAAYVVGTHCESIACHVSYLEILNTAPYGWVLSI